MNQSKWNNVEKFMNFIMNCVRMEKVSVWFICFEWNEMKWDLLCIWIELRQSVTIFKIKFDKQRQMDA